MKKSLWALLLMANGAAFAQTQVNEYHPGITAEGAVYYLPKTTIQVNVRVEKTTYTPGEFCKYADKYLRLGKVNETGYSTYKIIGTDITSYGEADKDKAFAVKVNPKTAVCNLRLAEDGRLLAVNTDAPKEKALPKPFEPSAKPAPIDPRSFLNQEILAAGSVMKMAELTASEIYDIRESRNSLIKGEADFMPKDGEQLKLMLAKLEQQDKVLTSMFAGTISKATTETLLTLSPDKDIDPKALKAKEKADQAAKAKGNCLYVNEPSKMHVTLADGNKKVAEYEAAAGQFGRVELLSGDLFNKHFTTRLTLNPESGAVERLTAEEPK